jgi:endonuclease-3
MFDTFFNQEKRDLAETVFERLNAIADRWERTAVQETRDLQDPFRTLIAAMLSARTREEATRTATNNLFQLADTPQAILQLSDDDILKAIQAVTYPEPKVAYVRGICQKLVDEFAGHVPRKLTDLTSLPGVGWKTAVLTQWIAFEIAEEICVDVHVARIGKRLGLVQPATQQPPRVSQELMQVVPERLWGVWNPLMVRFGREICRPTRPQCKVCPLNDLCPKIGVK